MRWQGWIRLVFLAVSPSLFLRAEEDPFKAPPELTLFVHRATMSGLASVPKLHALQAAIFASKEQGGLGIVYDNDYTRTVEEVWRDRKANCLSLVALFVACARVLDVDARYAEALNTNRWTRVNGIIRLERHVVALVRLQGGDDLVADFLPHLRKRLGSYIVRVMSPTELRSLFFANKAVEQLDRGDLEGALVSVETAVTIDPKVSTGWNTRGVLLQRKDDLEEAERSFRKALSADPRDFAAAGNLELLLRRLGRVEEAMVLRAKIGEVRKKDPYFQFFQAEEAIGTGDWNLAEKHLKAAIKIHPTEPEFHLLYARLHLERGDMDKAKAAIVEAQKFSGPAEQGRYENKIQALQRKEREEAEAGKKK